MFVHGKYREIPTNNRFVIYGIIPVSIAPISGFILFMGISSNTLSGSDIEKQITNGAYEFQDALTIVNNTVTKKDLFDFYSSDCEVYDKQVSALLSLERAGKIKLIPINVKSELESWNLLLGGLPPSERDVVKGANNKPALMNFDKKQPKSHVGYLSENAIVNEFLNRGNN